MMPGRGGSRNFTGAEGNQANQDNTRNMRVQALREATTAIKATIKRMPQQVGVGLSGVSFSLNDSIS